MLGILEWGGLEGVYDLSGEELRTWFTGWELCHRSGSSWHGWYRLSIKDYEFRMGIVLDYIKYSGGVEVEAGWVSDDNMLYSGEIRGGVFIN